MSLATVTARVREEVGMYRAYDPAITSNAQVLLTSPGLHAVWAYRLSHRLWTSRMFLLAQIVRQTARRATGVDIHPAATIGARLLIDHGTGVVIGETAEIGDDVVIYHGVTLGGRVNRPGKRHPTVGDGVFLGAYASVLGPVTVGAGARVGAHAVVLTDVPAEGTAVGNPARVLAPTLPTTVAARPVASVPSVPVAI